MVIAVPLEFFTVAHLAHLVGTVDLFKFFVQIVVAHLK